MTTTLITTRGQFNKRITLVVFTIVETASKVQLVNTRIQEKITLKFCTCSMSLTTSVKYNCSHTIVNDAECACLLQV